MLTEHAHHRALSRSLVNAPSPYETRNVYLTEQPVTAARWVDPALGFAVSV